MLSWINLQLVSIPSLIILLFVLALVISSVGFYKTVYFISVGYAFSITGMVIATIIALHDNLTWISILQSLFLLIWSVRLGGYLVRRERQSSFSAQQQRNDESTAAVTRPIQFAIWISVSLLYVAMFSPSLFVLSSAALPTSLVMLLIQVLGLVIMGGGLLLEAVGDQQKSNFKAKFPKNFCNVGLYRWMRCPNYLGEILFWLGNWVIAVTVYASVLQWLISLVGLACIVLIMLGSTKRLERSQEARYGSLAEYQSYIQSVPVLIPFIPLYTLKHIRFYLE